jgi:hypothetical protein
MGLQKPTIRDSKFTLIQVFGKKFSQNQAREYEITKSHSAHAWEVLLLNGGWIRTQDSGVSLE